MRANRLNVRLLLVASLLGLGGVLGAAPSVAAAVPSPASADDPEIIPAEGNPCGVDLTIELENSADPNPIGYGDIRFTNLETGATYLQRSRYTATETFEPSTGSWQITVVGKIWTPLYPGEPGPAGIVQEPGLWIVTSGTLKYTLNSEGALTAFSLKGTYDDVCALLNHT